MEKWQLQQLQGLPLDIKIEKTKLRIQEWYEHWDGQVYVSFSGGKDSTVLLHLVRSMYPEVPAVFSDTGLEYPEIREFVQNTDNVIWRKPGMSFNQVILTKGYPVISKEQAQYIREAKNSESEKLRNLRLNGRNGSFKISDKWKYLLDAPFKISEKCCHVMKKEPLRKYEKESKRYPIIGTMADESKLRMAEWIRVGCNSFDGDKKSSKPISFWLESDIWKYIKSNDLQYSKIYDMGYQRTGCMFCMFGVHLEQEPNRFQKMALTHPKQWDYCMEKLGLDDVLDFIGVPYIPNVRTFNDDRNHKYQQFKMSV